MAVKLETGPLNAKVCFDSKHLTDGASWSHKEGLLRLSWDGLLDEKKMNLSNAHEWMHYIRQVHAFEDSQTSSGEKLRQDARIIFFQPPGLGGSLEGTSYYAQHTLEEAEGVLLPAKVFVQRATEELASTESAIDSEKSMHLQNASELIENAKGRLKWLHRFLENDLPILHTAHGLNNLEINDYPGSTSGADSFVKLPDGRFIFFNRAQMGNDYNLEAFLKIQISVLDTYRENASNLSRKISDLELFLGSF
ncbi:MAG: hypothetical protein H7301_14265 [Cryobacterium sp.]|nr:hypothetical protein [Oligoflexia bacterium]